MIAELEAELAATLAAKEREVAAAQQGLDAAVAHKFAALEKQLDGKVGEGWAGWVGWVGGMQAVSVWMQALSVCCPTQQPACPLLLPLSSPHSPAATSATGAATLCARLSPDADARD